MTKDNTKNPVPCKSFRSKTTLTSSECKVIIEQYPNLTQFLMVKPEFHAVLRSNPKLKEILDKWEAVE